MTTLKACLEGVLQCILNTSISNPTGECIAMSVLVKHTASPLHPRTSRATFQTQNLPDFREKSSDCSQDDVHSPKVRHTHVCDCMCCQLLLHAGCDDESQLGLWRVDEGAVARGKSRRRRRNDARELASRGGAPTPQWRLVGKRPLEG
jgi:hypothetical protein